MQFSPQQGGGLGVARRPVRQGFRHEVHKLLYVNIDHSNGGIIRNLSECGAGLQAVTPLRPHEDVRLRFELLQPRVRIETTARVCWASASGQAGVLFSHLPERSSNLLRDWLLTQLLARAQQLFGSESVFQNLPSPPPGLLLSDTARDSVSLLIEPHYRSDSLSMRIRQSPRLLSGIVDALVLAIAVMLFAVIALSMVHVVPRWPVSAAVLTTSSAVFLGTYWTLSSVWMGMTPGRKLVRAAFGDEEFDSAGPQEPRSRFR